MGKAGKIFSILGTKLYRGFILEKNINPDEIDHSKLNSILVVVRHRMGDMLCALPMIESLRNNYPSSRLVLLTNSSTRFEEIFKGVKSPADAVVIYDNGFENYFNTLKTLQAENFDLAVVPSTVTYSGTNHLFGYHSHAKIRAGVGSKDFEKNPAGYLLNVKKDFGWLVKKAHQVERNLDIIRQMNIVPSVNSINIKPGADSLSAAESFYNENFPDKSRKIIGFHPGAGKETNVWPAERFAELIMQLRQEYNPYFYISQGPADIPYTSKLKNILIDKYSMNEAVFHSGKLMELAAIINKMDLFITNDTGVMHISSGLKTPVIALFGETYAYEWGPAGDNKFSIQSPNNSMLGIDINSVFKLSEKLLK